VLAPRSSSCRRDAVAGTGDLEQDIRYLERLNGLLLPDYNFSADIREWREKFTPSQQRAGLKAAFADLAEMTMALNRGRIAELDRLLGDEGFPTLTELQFRHGRRIRRLLRAGRLKTEDDAVALKGMIDAGLLSEEQRATALLLIDCFRP
jgi:hypothetical protein